MEGKKKKKEKKERNIEEYKLGHKTVITGKGARKTTGKGKFWIKVILCK